MIISNKVIFVLLLLFVVTLLAVTKRNNSFHQISSSSLSQLPPVCFEVLVDSNNTHLIPETSSSPNRNDILERTVKGYREQTYWGSEHPLGQRIEDFDSGEFSDFIENEVKTKDVDLYWGAEY